LASERIHGEGRSSVGNVRSVRVSLEVVAWFAGEEARAVASVKTEEMETGGRYVILYVWLQIVWVRYRCLRYPTQGASDTIPSKWRIV
jgi:hypothetical protein